MEKKYERYIGVLFLIPVILFLFIGGDYLKFLVMILSLIGLKEFYDILKNKNYVVFKSVGYLFTLIYFLLLDYMSSDLLLFLVIMITCVCLSISIFDLKHNFIEGALTILGFLYIPVIFSLIPKIESMTFGKYFVWLIFISSWGNDTFAYYSGRIFGKHKLCPQVSPNKSVEGAIGGIIGSILCCTIFGIIMSDYGLNINILHYALIGLIGSMFAIIGDLGASSIKRYIGIKDYSNLIPGHGGILDRFDSTLFVAIVVYFYSIFIIRM